MDTLIMKKIRRIFALLLLASAANAGLPPTTSKVTSDSVDVTTFKFRFPNFTGTHTGTLLTLGVNSIAGGGTGAATAAAGFSALAPGSPTLGAGIFGNGVTWGNQSAGADGTFLMYDSSQTNGVRAETLAAGSGISISQVGATTTIASVASTLSTIASVSYSGYHNSSCSWARTNTSYGDPSAPASGCALVQRANVNFGTVTGYGATSGTGALPGIIFTPTISANYMTCATAFAAPNVIAVGATVAVQLTDGSATQLSEAAQTGLVSTSYFSFPNCTLFNVGSGSIGSAFTIKLQSKASAGSLTIGGNGGNAIEWSIFPVDVSTAPNFATKTQPYTATASDDYILLNSNNPLTLPDCTSLGQNKVWHVKNICQTCTATIKMGGSNTYEDGSVTVTATDPFIGQDFLCNQGSVIYGF